MSNAGFVRAYVENKLCTYVLAITKKIRPAVTAAGRICLKSGVLFLVPVFILFAVRSGPFSISGVDLIDRGLFICLVEQFGHVPVVRTR